MRKALNYKLLENGIDSIKHGVEHFIEGDKDPWNFKYAVLHVFQGIELILKEKLFRVNPLLIYANIDQRINDSSRTITFDKLIARLENLGVKLSKTHLETCKEIQVVRNRIEHRDVSFNVDEVQSLIGESIKFLIDFLKSELNDNLQNRVEEQKYKILVKMIDYYEERLRIAQREIEEYLNRLDPKDASLYEKVSCPECFNETVLLPPGRLGTVRCYYCGEEFYAEECARCGTIVLIEHESEDVVFCENCEKWFQEG